MHAVTQTTEKKGQCCQVKDQQIDRLNKEMRQVIDKHKQVEFKLRDDLDLQSVKLEEQKCRELDKLKSDYQSQLSNLEACLSQ